MFSPSTYQHRRASLCTLMHHTGLVFIPGNDESPMNYRDNVYRFRQDSTFLYFFGIDKPGYSGLIDCQSGVATLFGHETTIDHVIWMGPQPSLADLADMAGGVETASPDTLATRLTVSDQTLHLLPPYRDHHRLLLASLLRVSPEHLSRYVSEDLIRAIVALRSLKTDEELFQLEQACTRTSQMHLTGMRTAKPGMLESEVMAAVRAVPLSYGRDVSFPIICSVRGEVLHNHHHDNRLNSGQLLLLDAGGESDFHYAGDMTRTFPVGPTFTAQQAEVYQIVLDSMKEAFSMIRPGAMYRDIHLAAARVITEGLQQLGLMKGDVSESVAAGAHGLFFPHGLGHMMGLDVHDMENLGEDFVGYREGLQRSSQLGLKSLRLARELQERFVLTVEPGIYFIPALIETWKQKKHLAQFIQYEVLPDYYDFGGIRLEDDVVVTHDGYRILGTPAPKELRDVESIRQQAISG